MLLLVSGHFDQILSQFSQAMIMAIHSSHPQCELLQDLLVSICNLENRTRHLIEMTYEWCSVVCKHYHSLVDGKDLLLLSLKIGFRHLDSECRGIEAGLIHTDHHQQMVDIVFKNGSGEAIADLLHAWTSSSHFHEPHESLNLCASYLINLHNLCPFSLRLRKFIIHSVRLIGYQPFEQVGIEEFVGLLSDLDIGIEDMDRKVQWAKLLLDIVQSSEGIQHLPHSYWELLVELSVSVSQWLEDVDWSPHIMTSLKANQEWDKLECWMGVVWMVWPLGDVAQPVQLRRERMFGGIPMEETTESITLSLFHQQPSAVQKLEQRMRQWSAESRHTIPEAFQRIYNQVHPKAV